MKTKILLFAGLLAFGLASCSKEVDPEVAIPQEMLAGVKLHADERNGKITFTTEDAWAASIVQTKASALSWVSISPTSGQAGEGEISLTLKANTTGQDRTVYVDLFCGGVKNQIEVTQLYTNADGTNGYKESYDILPDDELPEMVAPQSFFIANEDWFGHDMGSMNRFWYNGDITYRAYREANPGLKLGVTTQYAMNYAGRIFAMSKQAPRLVVMDAETLKMEVALDEIGGGDGRGCVGVDENTVYLSTSNGISIYDISSKAVTGRVSGVGSEDPGNLYKGQVGDMVRIGDRVFAALQGKGIAVIDTKTHALETLIGDANHADGVCMSRDGYLWITGNPLLKVDPYTLETAQTLALPEGYTGGKVGWGAWRPTSLCASTQQNVIYWNESEAGLVKYDIDKGDMTAKFLNNTSYGVARVDPATDYIAYPDARVYTAQGKIKKKFNVETYYWFPSHPFFEDANRPAIPVNQIALTPGEERKICLSDLVYDADNASRGILKTVDFTGNTLVEQTVAQDTLYLAAGAAEGKSSFKMRACSNGLTVEKDIQVLVVEPQD